MVPPRESSTIASSDSVNRCGLPGPAPLWLTVFAPRILWRYVRLMWRGYRLRRPTDDLRQLGGDILIQHDKVVTAWIGAESERRPSVDEVLAAAQSLRSSPSL